MVEQSWTFPYRTALVTAHLNKHYVQHGKWSVERIYWNNLNVVFEATSNSGEKLAIKSNQDPHENEREYSALKVLNTLTDQSVKALELGPRSSFIVLEWISGGTLLTHMHDAQRLQKIHEAGEWLRRFHDKTLVTLSDTDLSLSAMIDEPWRNDDRDWPHISQDLQINYEALRSEMDLHAQLHTDFQLHNLIDAPNGLVAIDPASERFGHPYFDVARFLTGMALYRRLSASPWPNDEATDRHVFLSAYGAPKMAEAALLDYVETLTMARLRNTFELRYGPSTGRNQRIAILDDMLENRLPRRSKLRRRILMSRLLRPSRPSPRYR
ncbi:hypothetical protein ACMA5I_04960 [Paracoccaceae bacterium GXU_MW_L88]